MAKYRMFIPDIHCNHCRMRITKALHEIGEKNFEVDIEKKQLIIETSNSDRVIQKLAEIDYSVSNFEEI
ncbi:MAG: heavy-metal-associated domain-containing protein [bacterium]|nr:heavy-metal-associated domain-containing protein [bacterium]